MNAENYLKLERELESVVERYVSESDLTIAESVAALELLKAKLIERWHAKFRQD